MTKELREKDWKPKLQSLINNYPEGVQYGEIEEYVSNMIIEAERRMKEKCLECVPLGMTYYDDLTQKDYRDGYNQGVDDSRTAISSLK